MGGQRKNNIRSIFKKRLESEHMTRRQVQQDIDRFCTNLHGVHAFRGEGEFFEPDFVPLFSRGDFVSLRGEGSLERRDELQVAVAFRGGQG